MEMPDSIRKILEASGISKPTTYPTEEEQAKASAEQANRERGNLKGIDCPDCLNRGYITVVDGTHTSVQICHCMKARESLRLIRLSGLKEMLDQYTLQRTGHEVRGGKNRLVLCGRAIWLRKKPLVHCHMR